MRSHGRTFQRGHRWWIAYYTYDPDLGRNRDIKRERLQHTTVRDLSELCGARRWTEDEARRRGREEEEARRRRRRARRRKILAA
jgi:hypothetical protein